MIIERDQDFEQLEDIAAMMTENTGIEFENGKYVYYGLDGRTAFAAVYISGAWAGWQAKAQAVPEGYVLMPKEIDSFDSPIANALEKGIVRDWSTSEIYAAMIEAQVSNQPTQFNLDEFLTMEEKLKHKGGVIKADLDRFIAYAEMVLEKAKALKEPK